MKTIKISVASYVHGIKKCLIAFSAMFFLHGCSFFNTHAQTVPNPIVEGPITGALFLRPTTTFDPATVGYQQAEYFISGTARNFINSAALQSDGKWQIQAAETASYKTRIVVYRPIDPKKFNGTVLIEWLNVSGALDAAPEWTMAHTELIRQGYAWVGISAQRAGIDGVGLNIGSAAHSDLKAANPARYAALVHPGDSFSFDIFSQAAQAVLHPNKINPLDGLQVRRSIAAGESQSAFRMTTYVNAIAPVAHLFDGYFIHSRGHSSAPLSQSPQAEITMPATVFIRDDLKVPVMMLQTESDLFVLGSYADRQADTALFRLWEAAGTAHADLYAFTPLGAGDLGNNPNVAAVISTAKPIPGFVECARPVNSGPQHFITRAAISALEKWIRDGVAPAHAQRLEISGNPPKFVRDSVGNALGGVRTPYVDAPIATLTGEPQPSNRLCSLIGTTDLFDNAALARLYPNHDAYVSKVNKSVDDAARDGFLLRPDGDLIKAWAQASTIGN